MGLNIRYLSGQGAPIFLLSDKFGFTPDQTVGFVDKGWIKDYVIRKMLDKMLSNK